MTGRIISHFEILGELGVGGMGVVYAARDLRLDRPVALKFLPRELVADQTARERFIQEARAASALNHPNICTIHEIGESETGEIFIAMALYQGSTLKQRLASGSVDPVEAVDIARQLSRGLSAAHQEDIVHRDIKPANVIVAPDGNVRILDFGLAKMASAHLTRTGSTLGTVAYMSPEQAQGEAVDHRADIWSVGCVLYEMIAGTSPFEAEHETAMVYRLMNDAPAPLRDHLPDGMRGIEAVVFRCLEKEPDARYGSADDLEHALAALAQPAPVPVVPRFRVGHTVALWIVAIMVGVWVMSLMRSEPPEYGGIAVLPFRAAAMDDAECQTYGEMVSKRLSAALRKTTSPYWIISDSDVRAFGIDSASEAATEFGAGLVVDGFCLPAGSALEVDFQIIDTRSLRTIADGDESASRSDLRRLALDVAGAISMNLPGWPGDVPIASETPGGTTVPLAFTSYVRGRAYMLRGDTDQDFELAIAELKHATSLDPDYAQGLTLLGETLLEVGRIPEAIETLEAAVEAAPDYVPARAALATTLRESGDLIGAQREMDLAISLDSTDWTLYRHQGDLLYAVGDIPAAERSLRKAIEMEPDYWPLRRELGVFLFEDGRPDEAREQFAVIEQLVPDSYRAAHMLGSSFQAIGDTDTAVRYFRRALDLNRNYGTLSNLAIVLHNQHRYEEAADLHREALSMSDAPDNYAVWGNLGFAELSAGRFDRADSAFSVALRMVRDDRRSAPGKPTLMIDQASYLAHLGRLDHAVALADSALERTSDSFARHSAAVVYEMAGNRERALSYIAEVLQAGYPIGYLESDSDLESLRADPRFQALLSGDAPGQLPEIDR